MEHLHWDNAVVIEIAEGIMQVRTVADTEIYYCLNGTQNRIGQPRDRHQGLPSVYK